MGDLRSAYSEGAAQARGKGLACHEYMHLYLAYYALASTALYGDINGGRELIENGCTK